MIFRSPALQDTVRDACAVSAVDEHPNPQFLDSESTHSSQPDLLSTRSTVSVPFMPAYVQKKINSVFRPDMPERSSISRSIQKDYYPDSRFCNRPSPTVSTMPGPGSQRNATDLPRIAPIPFEGSKRFVVVRSLMASTIAAFMSAPRE